MDENSPTYTHVDRRFAIAPMMDWTDRHCRFFHRLLSPRARLYTEMITADAILYGDRERLLAFDPAEHPVAVQLGGSDPERLARAAGIAEQFGYDEINLNIGCPSDRVQAGTFGACLMRDPDHVGRIVAAMKNAVSVPVTVKCRLGVDEQDPEPALDLLADAAVGAGCDGLWVHARKAWLKGLSAKENRNVPPLDYDRVERLKARLPHVFVGINGGIATVEAACHRLAATDGVMIGRAAYRYPEILPAMERMMDGLEEGRAASLPSGPVEPDWRRVVEAMMEYAGRHCAVGGRLGSVTRHMIGLFAGRPGARRWRRILTEGAQAPDAAPDILMHAYAAVVPAPVEPEIAPTGAERPASMVSARHPVTARG